MSDKQVVSLDNKDENENENESCASEVYHGLLEFLSRVEDEENKSVLPKE